MKVPFNDLSRIHSPLENEINQAFSRVIEKGAFILGSAVENFENNFAKYCQQPNRSYVAGVSNGLNAITLTLKALGIDKESEVIVPAHTFNATASAVVNSGSKVKLIDVTSDTALIDVSQLEEAITDKTVAIIPVHFYGQQADMESIMKIAEKYHLYVIEDAAQAHGSLRNGLAPGRLSNAATFSFYPGKNLGAFGDAGGIVSSDSELIEKIKQLRNYGQREKYHHEFQGYNERMDGIQGAVLNVKLSHLDNWNRLRSYSAQNLIKGLEDVDEIELPITEKGNLHTYHLFCIKTNQRDELSKFLKEKGIETGIHYPFPIHLQRAFSNLGYNNGDFPIAEDWAKKELSLPVFPLMSEEEVKYVSDSVKEFFTKASV